MSLCEDKGAKGGSLLHTGTAPCKPSTMLVAEAIVVLHWCLWFVKIGLRG